MTLASTDPPASPVIDLNLYGEASDARVVADGVRLARSFATRSPLATRTELRHAVFAHVLDAPERWRSLPPVPRAGSGDTVGLSGHDPSFNAVTGSSFRIAVDVGEWAATLVLTPPGKEDRLASDV